MLQQAGGTQIRYTRSSTLGQSWSAAITLSEAHSRFPSFVPDWSRGVLWLFFKDERDAGADSVARYSLDSGVTWSALEWVTESPTLGTKFPSPAVGPDGTHVAWSDERLGADHEAVFIKSRSSAPSGSNAVPAPGNAERRRQRPQRDVDVGRCEWAVTTYVIEAGSAAGAANIGVFPVGLITACMAASVAPGVYYVRVKASGAAGTGTASNEIIVTVR